MGHCTKHLLSVSMTNVCIDHVYHNSEFPEKSKIVTQHLSEGKLYAFVDIPERGYPPPTSLEPLGTIEEYREWSETQQRQAFTDAVQRATDKYDKSQS